MPERIKVVSIMEAESVTGPAKNLIAFAECAREAREDLPAVELSIAAYQRASAPASVFIRQACAAGIPVDLIRERHRFDFSVPDQMRRIVAGRDPHIVQTHNVKSHFFLRLSGIWRQHPWIAFHHGYTAEDLKMRCYNLLNRWSLRAPNHIVTVCQPFAGQLVREGASQKRISVLHNSVRPYAGVGLEAVQTARAAIPAAQGTPILVCAGRLSQEKGHIDLLEALAVLQKAGGPAFHLVLVGEGVERPRIERERARLGLEPYVTLVGQRHDVRPYYAMARAAILASHSEGSPNVLLEAMATGLPIVATTAGGTPEIVVHEETALLVEPRSPRALAGAIERVLRDDSLCNALAVRAREAVARHSPEAYRRSLTEIYRRVLTGAASS